MCRNVAKPVMTCVGWEGNNIHERIKVPLEVLFKRRRRRPILFRKPYQRSNTIEQVVMLALTLIA